MVQQIFVRVAAALGLIAAASCGVKTGASNQAQDGATMENVALTKLSITSSAFQDGQRLPAQFTCDGAGHSPPLAWGDPPADTRSFVVVVDDPVAPSGIFGHWGVFDIPSNVRSIAAGQSIGTEVTNDFGKPGYGAPCPPKGHGPHHYRFRLYALHVDGLRLGPNSTIADLDREAARHAIARAQLAAIYERK